MSQPNNDALLEQASEAINYAAQLMEHELQGTVFGDVLQAMVDDIATQINENNLEDLYNFNLPSLEKTLAQYSNDLSDQSRTHFINYNLLAEDTY